MFFALYSFVAVCAFQVLGWKFVAIPFLPVGTIGTAVAFYVGFKNNASYERLWEGRKIWGSISNLCRVFGAMTVSLSQNNSSEVKKLQQTLVRRQIVWCNALRLALRSTPALRNAHKAAPEASLIRSLFGEDYAKETLPEYLSKALSMDDQLKISGAINAPLCILQMQMADIEELSNLPSMHGTISEKMLDTIIECTKEQGASERLKSFPFPRQYAYFSAVFVWIFLLLLPFGLIDELAKASATGLVWSVIPFSTLISWMFITMEQVGDSSEDPFELSLNDVPLTSICRDIEIELLQMLGEKDLPEQIRPVADILM